MEKLGAVGGSRAVGPLVVGFAAVALALAALIPAIREGSPSPGPGPGPSPTALSEGYADLPLALAPTAAGPMDFVATGEGGSIAIGSAGAVIAPASPRAEPVRMSLVGASAASPSAMPPRHRPGTSAPARRGATRER